MKKLIFILIAMFIGVAVYSQDRTVSRTLSSEQTLYDYTGTADDTLGVNDQDTVAYTMLVNKSRPVLYNIQIDLEDAEAITGDYDVTLEGKVYSTDSWTEIDATNTAESGDVNITFNSDLSAMIDTTAATAEPFYRYFRIIIDAADVSAGSAKVNYVYWKFYER